MKKTHLFLILITTALFIFSNFPQYAMDNLKPAEKGVLDLSNCDFDHSYIPLDGQWLFYKDEFIPPHINLTYSKKQYGTINVPSTFLMGNYTQNDYTNNLSNFSYGSYYLHIILPKDVENIAFNLPTVGSSYNMYVNGDLVHSVGEIGIDKYSQSPKYDPKVITYMPKDHKLNIVIHISNFNYNYGGLFYSIHLGNPNNVYHTYYKDTIEDYFISGIFVSILLLQFILYLIKKNDKLSLYFSITCLTVWIRLSTNGSYILLDFFPNLSFYTLVKLEYLSFILSIPFFTIFLHYAFPQQFKKRIMNRFIIVGIICSLLIITFPPRYFYSILFPYQFWVILGVLYCTFIVLKAVVNRERGSFILLWGLIILLVTILNDILFSLELVQTNYYTNYGFLVLTLCMTILINYRYIKAYEKVNQLSIHLEYKNKKLKALTHNLENHVSQKTKELENAYKKIKSLALTDELTGLPNRRSLQRLIEYEEAKAKRHQRPFCIAILDIDNFKKINDTYGHDVGDMVLSRLAKIVLSSNRAEDYVARWGGEEFLLLFSNSSNSEAIYACERIRKAVQRNRFNISNNEFINITVSIGLFEYNVNYTIDECFKRADLALYHAKHNGKNKVTIYSDRLN